MFDESQLNKLKSDVQQIIQHVESVRQQLKQLKQQPLAPLLSSSLNQKSAIPTDNSLRTNDFGESIFTIDDRKSSLLEELTHWVQDTLNILLPTFGNPIIVFLKDFFCRFYYDFDRRSFIAPLKASILHLFFKELNGLLLFVEAFRDIFNGRLDGIIKLIAHYPMFKNRSGPFLTTLLYSAAKNASMTIVKYLIEVAKCPPNSQNRLMNSNDNDLPSVVGSTALHAAASIGHRDLVAYLIEHGADIHIKNQAQMTPVMIGMNHESIKQYFEDCLIYDYALRGTLTHLPITSIGNGSYTEGKYFWEYMPIDFNSSHYQLWYPFLTYQSYPLEHHLSSPNQTVLTLYFNVWLDLYCIDVSKFLLTQTFSHNSNVFNIAWIRCRDISFLNHNYYPMWQILLVKHYECENIEQMLPSLQFENFLKIPSKQQKLHLNTWYFCNTKTNLLLNDAMNTRRKQIRIDMLLIGNNLAFNLSDFIFTNADDTILGYIRWLPKYPMNSGENLTETFANEPSNNMMDDDINYVQNVEVENCDGEYDMDFEEETNESTDAKNVPAWNLHNVVASKNVPLPSIVNGRQNEVTCSSLSGYEETQRDLENISHKIQNLLNEATTSSSTHDWTHYKACFVKVSQDEISEYQKKLNYLIVDAISELSTTTISLGGKTFQRELKERIDNHLQNKPIQIDINRVKFRALDMYIDETIKGQTTMSKSAEVLEHLVEKVKYNFESGINRYVYASGKELETVPEVLKQIQLFYRCSLLQLPLFELAEELLKRIESNTVCTVTTTTGSGQSTLLPVLLVAYGYPKVVVTQSRRLACKLLCHRVNQTMVLTKQNEPKLAGFCVSGLQNNVKAPILYITDGLMKEYLLNDNDELLYMDKNRGPTVFILEIGERNVNIDLCIALFLRLLVEKPQLRERMKLILTSSSIDKSVSELFSRVNDLHFHQFTNLTMHIPYTITEVKRPNDNLLDVVQELYKKRSHRQDQILCFVSSVVEAYQSCHLLAELSRGAIVARPLIQSQSVSEQQQYMERESVFFSTTVAETSLTFPSLAFVVDTGVLNRQVYDVKNKQTILKERPAAEATIKQRMGRLGRTQPGEYHALYDYNVDEQTNLTPQICEMRLTDLEFALRRTQTTMSLKYLKRYLPDPPSDLRIQSAIDELKQSGILTAEETFTSLGTALSKLPNLGSVNMTNSVYAALTKYNCGGDLIVLSSILHVLNTSAALKEIPAKMKSSDGDFMTLINVMERLLMVKQSISPKQFNLRKFCEANDLLGIEHLLKRALKRYNLLETLFSLSEEYCEKAQLKTGDWSLIARSLLEGYQENLFISLKDLQGKTHNYISYCPAGKEIVGVLDVQSTLVRPIDMAPVSIVLARDIRYSSTVRDKAVIYFAGEINIEWIKNIIERQLNLTNREVNKPQTEMLLSKVKQMFSLMKCRLSDMSHDKLILKGPGDAVIEAELYIRQQLTEKLRFQLGNEHSSNLNEYKNFNNNLDHMSKLLHIFNPMIWRWDIQEQVKVSVDFIKVERFPSILENVCEVTVEGRVTQNERVRREFKNFFKWVKTCAVMRHPNSGVPPQTMKPQLRCLCSDIEERIARITDSKRSSVDLWSQLTGRNATRETRMEVVAWIAVCKFHCHLEGGFVRDWVVGHYTARPQSEPATWLKHESWIPSLDKQLIPSDLDCHLPTHYYFDIDNFQNYLYKYRIECAVIREDWRYVVVLDEHAATGPFTMDLIEPHVALTHDRIDFDVNNLYLEKDYTHELGMRVDITEKPYNIKLETIIDNIKNKTFQILRPVDAFVEKRVHKMISRGWKKIGIEMNVIPNPPQRYNVVLVQLPKDSPLYTIIDRQMCEKISDCQVISIQEIKHRFLEDVYLAMKTLIARACKGHNPNVRELFHGTSGEAISGILNDGFDDRYFSSTGLYGHGAYFADDPAKSHNYTKTDPNDGTRVIIYSKVILGKQYLLEEVDPSLLTAPVGYHSVLGKHNPEYPEYIVYRFGQALPYLKIIYKKT